MGKKQRAVSQRVMARMRQIGHKYNLSRAQMAAWEVMRVIRSITAIGHMAYLPVMPRAEWVEVVEVEE